MVCRCGLTWPGWQGETGVRPVLDQKLTRAGSPRCRKSMVICLVAAATVRTRQAVRAAVDITVAH